MHYLFDYIFIRIYKWYEGFENEPSEFTAKLLVAFIQVFLLLDIIAALSYFVVLKIPILYLKIIMVVLGLAFYIRLYYRYRDLQFIKSLKKRWSKERRVLRILRGLTIPVAIVVPVVLFIILAKNNPTFLR
jgi:hypothetical protein